MSQQVDRIAIVGTGLIGSGWAAFYASKGFLVSLYDIDSAARQQGRNQAIESLAFLREQELLSGAEFDQAKAALRIADDLGAAVGGALLVQESVAERYEVKKAVYRQLDEATSPETVLASSSSGLLISEIQQGLEFPGRCLIAHPFNPPYLIPLVELVPGKLTDRAIVRWAQDFYTSLGKTPVILNAEIPGHIANRLQAAVWREAVDLVLKGVASLADVDLALTAGPGLRWPLMGSHMTFHLGGGDEGIEHFVNHVGAAWKELWQDMANWTSLPPETADALADGVAAALAGQSVQQKMRWRDEKLVALLKILDDQVAAKSHGV